MLANLCSIWSRWGCVCCAQRRRFLCSEEDRKIEGVVKSILKRRVSYVTRVVTQFGIGFESLVHMTWKLLNRNAGFSY